MGASKISCGQNPRTPLASFTHIGKSISIYYKIESRLALILKSVEVLYSDLNTTMSHFWSSFPYFAMSLVAISLIVEATSLFEALCLLGVTVVNLASIDAQHWPFVDLAVVTVCTTCVAMIHPGAVGWRLVFLFYGHMSATAYGILYGR